MLNITVYHGLSLKHHRYKPIIKSHHNSPFFPFLLNEQSSNKNHKVSSMINQNDNDIFLFLGSFLAPMMQLWCSYKNAHDDNASAKEVCRFQYLLQLKITWKEKTEKSTISEWSKKHIHNKKNQLYAYVDTHKMITN